MHLSKYLYPTIFVLTSATEAARKPADSVLLSNVKTLTLRKDLKTTHNRVAAVPQLQCTGGDGRGLYEVEVMRCKNQGSDYDDENVQWTCTASLPSEFKLGSTDVICEGFASSSDPYVLKGSCAVEYRLLLTDIGEEKYGRSGGSLWEGYKGKGYINWPGIIFWGIFIAVVGWMIYAAFIKDRLNGTGRRGGGGFNPGWGGGGGGGAGGGDDPPPPYSSYNPSPKPKTSTSGPRATPAQAQQGWRPGFWTGTLGGAAAGYLAGNRTQNQQQPRNQGAWGNNGGSFFGNQDNMGGSSSRSRTSSYGSSRHESSGFGSTSRR